MAPRANAENFEELVLKSELPVLVDFYSDSCIPCKMMAGVVGDIEDDYEGKLNVYKVNVNFDESLASKYEVLADLHLLHSTKVLRQAELQERQLRMHCLDYLKD